LKNKPLNSSVSSSFPEAHHQYPISENG